MSLVYRILRGYGSARRHYRPPHVTKTLQTLIQGILTAVCSAILLLPTPDVPLYAAGSNADPEWVRWDSGLPSRAYIVDLETIPMDAGGVIAALYGMPGLWLSRDHGETWQELESPFANIPIFTVLWDDMTQGLWVGSERGLHFSPWSREFRQWMDEDSPSRPITSLQQDRQGCLYAMVGAQGLFRRCGSEQWRGLLKESHPTDFALSPNGQTIVVGTIGNGLWISRDAGRTWEKGGPFQNTSVLAVLISHQRAGLILAATEDSLWSSEDHGATWRQRDAGTNTRIVTFAEGPDGTILAGITGGAAISTDGGRQWTVSRAGFLAFSPVQAFAFLPHSPGGYLLLAGTREGIYRSGDQGRSWERVGKGLGFVEVNCLAKAEGGRIVAGTSLGLYYRDEDDARWIPALPLSDQNAVYDLVADQAGRVLYAGMEGQLVRSQDGGKTWRKVFSTLAMYGFPGLLMMSDSPDHLLARVTFERAYESFDGGRSWQERWSGMSTSHIVLTMAQSPAGELWAGTNAGLFRWDPHLQKWEQVPFPDPEQSIYAIAFATPPDRGIFVGATEGLWFSEDGMTWKRCGEHTLPYTVTSIAFSAPGVMLAGTRYYGLYVSWDAGNTWKAVPDLPSDMTVNDILIDNTSGRVYVATTRGLFFSDDNLCASEPGQAFSAHAPAGTATAGTAWLKWWERIIEDLPTPVPAVHTLRPDDRILRAAVDVGFRAIVQVFSWAEIEPTNDDWRWEYYDFLVNAAEYYGLDLIARLDHPPQWAMVEHPATFECPFHEDAYIEFVERTARRYRGRIKAYIIWNEPNLAAEWRGEPSPAVYARLLRRAYVAIKRIDPLALVISAGLASTNEITPSAMDDRVFLAELYRWGAKPFFDVLGAHPYGFAYSPDEPSDRYQGLNYQRLLALREVMRVHGDAGKPVWVTEVGWTTKGLGDHAWLTVHPETQAAYLLRAWQKAREEWPWLTLFTVWNISAGVDETADEKAGYSILYPDGTPKPAYFALRDALSASKKRTPLKLTQAVATILGLANDPVSILREDVLIHLGDSE